MRGNAIGLIAYCMENKELLAEFDRLNGTNLCRRGSMLDRMVDESSGRYEADARLFADFVVEHIAGYGFLAPPPTPGGPDGPEERP